MVQRAVAVYGEKYIGIESIYTCINGKQINIPEKLKEIRELSCKRLLYCPCGCGNNLILVAGEHNWMKQHFRIHNTDGAKPCNAVIEGRTSIDSKIVLKCWLDSVLCTDDVESRVPISGFGITERRYEFTFLSRRRNLAVVYSNERVNITLEKMEQIRTNVNGIDIIYIVDMKNTGFNGQYPERMMQIQEHQGYCLLLSIEGNEYTKASIKTVYYLQNLDGEWEEVTVTDGKLTDYSITLGNKLTYKQKELSKIIEYKIEEFRRKQERECEERELARERIEEQKKQKEEQRKIWLIQQEKEAEKRREEEQKRREETERVVRERFEQIKKNNEKDAEFERLLHSDKLPQDRLIRNSKGVRAVQCVICGKIGKDNAFGSYGMGVGKINLGLCYDCERQGKTISNDKEQKMDQSNQEQQKKNDGIRMCPQCYIGYLIKRKGKYGAFWGCSQYPKCAFTENLR